ncbi:MAG: tRNA preQ1(34) S-adenosylmethionine ribosyltransferase-isomerase QueA [Betaproteobacteria bacterium]|nr:tRNA preQ1(34) S-adenosylmethionine ribosyltransferase-isomerase QueA [Betaproteobacteria bacterium]
MKLSDFDYDLPPGLIAQHPARERRASRLLHLDGITGTFVDRRFSELPQWMQAGDVMVFNDTRVIRARLAGRKQSGGKVEVLIERVLGPDSALAQVHASRPPRIGSTLLLVDAVSAAVEDRRGEFYTLRFEDCNDVFALLERRGAVPLPPYITHPANAEDEARYQTVYARDPGAVAAPTAGLHFDRAMLDTLRTRGVRLAFITLHVGAGTFQPVRVPDISGHVMHGEWYRIPPETVEAVVEAKKHSGRVLAVGSTALRALEAAAAGGGLKAGYGETNLFIVPGFRFRVAERLLTNFHLPKSTLLMLVAAFGGLDNIRRAYRHAVEARYRFYSYGDAMLIERQQD